MLGKSFKIQLNRKKGGKVKVSKSFVKDAVADPNGLEKVYLKPCEYVSIYLRPSSNLKMLKTISLWLAFYMIMP